MHIRHFDLADGTRVVVNFNPDFRGMAEVHWSRGTVLSEASARIPAIALTVGIADLADGLREIAEQAQKLKDQAANKLAPKPLDTRTEFGYTIEDVQTNVREG